MTPATWTPEPELLDSLDRAVPVLMASQKENGQFGTEPWISTDQNCLLALAAAWSLPDSAHYHSGEVLDAIARGGHALIDAQDENGMWMFRKKDYSTWGPILMPWAYSRWVRAYQLVCEDMSAADRRRWEEGLILGYGNIEATCLGRVHNIPAHHAMGLYCAGTVFGRKAWQERARHFMHEVVAAQSPNGWWAEFEGPVVAYNFTYSEAVGVYHALSGDAAVLESLERAARYHANLTYPNGTPVETVDGRNPYGGAMRLGNAGFTYSAAGRGYLARQHGRQIASGQAFDADYAANILLHGAEGNAEEMTADRDDHQYRMGDEALVVRSRPWFLCLSALTTEIPDQRWGQDRQNFLSVYHDRTGLILGGGNTKLQPLWSNFTIGDTSLLFHTPGDEDPDFRPRSGLVHTPEKVEYQTDGKNHELTLQYGVEECRVQAQCRSDSLVDLAVASTKASGLPVEAHLTLMPHLGANLVRSCGETIELGEQTVSWPGGEDVWIAHAGWRLWLPAATRLEWPALPHNPYRKAGEAEIAEARLVVIVPLAPGVSRVALRLEVDDD